MTDDPPRWAYDRLPDHIQAEVERIFRKAAEKRAEQRRQEPERRPLPPFDLDDFRIERL